MIAGPDIASDKRIDGELRYVAALMADIADSTEITERLGSERSFLLMQDILGLLWAEIEAMRGHPLNFTGDGVFAVFGAPVAVEQASLIACRAALAISDLMQRESSRLQQAYGLSPRLRIGIASGEVLVTGVNLGGTFNVSASGSAVNLASRLQNFAPLGRIACSAQVVTDVGPRASFASLGTHRLKGYADEQEVFDLLSLHPGKAADAAVLARPDTIYVGRDTELDLIARWATEAGAKASLVIEGEAGIGKSRLLAEALARLGGARRPVIGACTTETVRRPLYPLIEVLRNYIGWHPLSDAQTTQAALAAFLPGHEARLGVLADLVGGRSLGDQQAASDEALVLREQLIRSIIALGTRTDLMLVIEDAHWIDPLSAGVLAAIVDSRPQGFHLIVTRRTAPPKDWLPASQTLRLRPLRRGDIAQIAVNHAPSAGNDPGFIDLVAEKSEGNPFFATEMLRHFDGKDARRLTASGIGTIQNLVFARFDPLDAATKEVLRIAAAIGRSFSLTLLGRVAGLSAQGLTDVFDRTAGLVELTALDGEEVGQFSHVLWRETIHGSIPSARRAVIHRQIGETLEALEQDNLAAVAETLVYHFEQAAMPDKAVVYLGIAARNALRLYALETCDAQLDRAFALLARSPNLVSDLEFGQMLKLWSTCLDLIGNFAKVKRVLAAHLPRLQDDRANPLYSECLSMMAIAHCHAGNFRHSLDLADSAIARAEAAGNAKAVATAKVAKARVLVDSGAGTIAESAALFQDTAGVADSLVDMHLACTRLYHFIALYRSVGRFGEAAKWNEVLFQLAVTTKDRHAMVLARWSRGVLRVIANEVESSLDDLAASRGQAIPGTGHWMVANSAYYSARMRSGEDVPLEVFASVIARCEGYEDSSLGNATLVNLTLWYFLHGKIRLGWKQLLLVEDRFRTTGSAEARVHVRFLRAEILLSIAGLGPARSGRPKLALGDVVKALTLRLTARNQAEQILSELLTRDTPVQGFFAGRACFGLAVLARAKGQKDRAADLFARSIAHYEAEGLLGEAKRIRAVSDQSRD